MATETLKSNPVTNLDATPIIQMTSGEGASGRMSVQTDRVANTTANDAGSTYRLARFPTCAKIKHVWAYLSGMDNNATGAWVADFNVAFSDATNDGTPPALQGAIPTSAKNGATTTVAAYSSPNILFGQVTAGNSGALVYKEITFNGTFTPANRDQPLWNVLGFTNAQGVAQDPGGFFDILVYVSHSAGTAHAGEIGIEVDYVI